jgi:hypothetical protein
VTGHWSGLTSVSGQFTWVQRKGVRPAHPRVPGTGASGRAPRGAERGVELIGRVARPVTCDRTHPIARGALWTPIGRQVQRVRSNGEAGPVTATGLSLTRTVTICPVVTGRVRSP